MVRWSHLLNRSTWIVAWHDVDHSSDPKSWSGRDYDGGASRGLPQGHIGRSRRSPSEGVRTAEGWPTGIVTSLNDSALRGHVIIIDTPPADALTVALCGRALRSRSRATGAHHAAAPSPYGSTLISTPSYTATYDARPLMPVCRPQSNKNPASWREPLDQGE